MRACFLALIVAQTVAIGSATAPAFAAAAPAAKRTTRFVPPDGSCLLIVGQSKADIEDYTSKIAVPPAGLMAYTSLKNLEGLSKPAEYFGQVQDCTSLLEKHPKAVLQIGLYLVNSLDDAADGKLDANMDKLADWLKAADRPIYLRVGYEFDLPENKYAPAAYIKAFRRLREHLDTRGATNVSYVWHSYAAQGSEKLRDWYPGDEYVDWVAVSFFSTKQSHLETVAKFARERGKPLMIAESCPRGMDLPTKGREALTSWFAPMFAYATRNNAKAICYINRDWESLSHWQGKGWGNALISTSDAVKAAWIKEVSGRRYIKASDDVFKLLGYKPIGNAPAPK